MSSIGSVGASNGLPPGIPPLPGGAASGATGAAMSASANATGLPGTGYSGGSTGAGTPGSSPFAAFSSAQATGVPGGAAGTQTTGSNAFRPSDATTGTPGTSGTGSTSGGASGAAGTSSASNAFSASGEDTFLKLLVAQMQNQDPSSPMDTTSFVTELAQFNTVEQMLNMQQTMQSALTAQQSTEGTVLLGRTVTYTVPSLDASNPTVGQGQVTAVNLGSAGVQLQVNGQNIPLGQVTGVSP